MAAGNIIRASDFGAPGTDVESADEGNYTNTSYAAGTTPTGATFTAPTSGIVVILWSARLQANTANTRTCISVSVRTGSTLGAGTVVSGADDDSALETPQDATGGVPTTRIQASMHRVVTGLTPGAVYNAQLEHRMLSAGNGSIFVRRVDVLPWPA